MSRPTVYEPLSTMPAQHREAQLPGSGNAPVQRRGTDREPVVAGLQPPAVRDPPLEGDDIRAGPPRDRERAARQDVALTADLLELDGHGCRVAHVPLDRGAAA